MQMSPSIPVDLSQLVLPPGQPGHVASVIKTRFVLKGDAPSTPPPEESDDTSEKSDDTDESLPVDGQQTMFHLPRDGYAFNKGALIPYYAGGTSALYTNTSPSTAAASSADAPPSAAAPFGVDPSTGSVERQMVTYNHINGPTAAQKHRYFLSQSCTTPIRLPARWHKFRVHASKTCHFVKEHRDKMCVHGILAEYPNMVLEDRINWCRDCPLIPEQRRQCYIDYTVDSRHTFPLEMCQRAPWQFRITDRAWTDVDTGAQKYLLKPNTEEEIQLLFVSHQDAPSAEQVHTYLSSARTPDPSTAPPGWHDFQVHASLNCHMVKEQARQMLVKAVRSAYPAGSRNWAEELLPWCTHCSVTRDQRVIGYRRYCEPRLNDSEYTGLQTSAPWQCDYRQHTYLTRAYGRPQDIGPED